MKREVQVRKETQRQLRLKRAEIDRRKDVFKDLDIEDYGEKAEPYRYAVYYKGTRMTTSKLTIREVNKILEVVMEIIVDLKSDVTCLEDASAAHWHVHEDNSAELHRLRKENFEMRKRLERMEPDLGKALIQNHRLETNAPPPPTKETWRAYLELKAKYEGLQDVFMNLNDMYNALLESEQQKQSLLRGIKLALEERGI